MYMYTNLNWTRLAKAMEKKNLNSQRKLVYGLETQNLY